MIGPWMDTCSRIVLHDLRGHGEATGGVSRLGTAEHRDLLALLERLGDGPFVLVGRGLGLCANLALVWLRVAGIRNRPARVSVSDGRCRV